MIKYFPLLHMECRISQKCIFYDFHIHISYSQFHLQCYLMIRLKYNAPMFNSLDLTIHIENFDENLINSI